MSLQSDLSERMERATTDLFWVPRDVDVIDREDLVALSKPGAEGYLNVACRLRRPASELPALVAEVSRFHRGEHSRVQVCDTIQAQPLDAALTEYRYAPTHTHDARVVAVTEFVPRSVSAVTVRRVVDEQTLRDAWAVIAAGFERPVTGSAQELKQELTACASPTGRVQRFVAYLNGEPVSSGGLSLHPELSFGFLWAGCTVPAARGRGAYSAIVAERVRCALQLGAEFVGSYARQNTSSRLLAAQGFAVVGQMTYWHRISS